MLIRRTNPWIHRTSVPLRRRTFQPFLRVKIGPVRLTVAVVGMVVVSVAAISAIGSQMRAMILGRWDSPAGESGENGEICGDMIVRKAEVSEGSGGGGGLWVFKRIGIL